MKYTYNYNGEQIMIKKMKNNLENLQINTKTKISKKIERTKPKPLGPSKKKKKITITMKPSKIKSLILDSMNKLKDKAVKEIEEKEVDLRSVEANPRLVVQNFKLKKGVTLKTSHFIIKNKKSKDYAVDQKGERKITKSFFDKHLKGMHKRNASANSRQNLRKMRSRINSAYRRGSVAKTFVDSLKVVKNIHNPISSATSDSNITNKRRDMKIFFKNYHKFVQKTSKTASQPFSVKKKFLEMSDNDTPGRDSSKQIIEEKDEDIRLMKINEEYNKRNKNFNFFKSRENQPVEFDETAKYLNMQNRKRAKRGRVKTGNRRTRVRNARSNMRRRGDDTVSRKRKKRMKSANLVKSYYN